MTDPSTPTTLTTLTTPTTPTTPTTLVTGNSKWSSDKIVLSLFNKHNCSDILLVFNSTQFYLISDIIKAQAPKLFSEIEAGTIHPSQSLSVSTSDMPKNKTSDDKTIENLSNYLLQTFCNKKKITINDPTVSVTTVTAVLEYIYGKTLDDAFIKANMIEIYAIGDRFGIDDIKEKINMTIRSTSDEQFLELRQVIKTDSAIAKVIDASFVMRKFDLANSKVLEFFSQVDFDNIMKVVTSEDSTYTEEEIFSLANAWCQNHTSQAEQCEQVMAGVKLEGLSPKTIIEKVKTNPYIKQERYFEFLEKMLHRIPYTPCVRSTSVIAVGKLGTVYFGYRMVTRADIDSAKFIPVFWELYNKLNGIPSLDDFVSNIVSCIDCELENYKNCYIRTYQRKLKKGDIVQFSTAYTPPEDFKAELSIRSMDKTLSKATEKLTGLFIRDTVSF